MKKKLIMWSAKENKLFSRLSGESFTNKEVVLTHIFLICFIMLCALAETLNQAI